MTTMLVDTENAGTAEFIGTVQSVLQNAFDTPFDMTPLADADHGAGFRHGQQNPTIERLRDNCYRVMIRFSDVDAAGWMASGEVSTSDPHLLKQLAKTVLTAIDRTRSCDEYNGQLNDYVQQLGDHLEELVWLRKLARHLHDCDASRSLADVCGSVLPSLRELIHAEAIAVIALDRASDEGLPSESVWIGTPVIGLDACGEFAARLAGRPTTHPIVMSPRSRDPAACHEPGIRTAIVVRLELPGCHYGWLVAVNRQANGEEAFPTVSGAAEFGTIEAGLLQATAVMLASHTRNAELFREQKQLTIGVIRTLINAIDAKDRYTRGHSDRVARMAKRIAVELGLDGAACEQLYITGLLHDVGKIGIPDTILQKAGPLTPDEFDLIKQHPQIGYDIVRPLRQLSYTLPGVLHHHESVDGKGYPGQLRGDEIPLAARILAVVDAYDAMTSCRPYRHAMVLDRAEAILRENSGKQWDANIVETFFSILDDIHEICKPTTASTVDPPQANPIWSDSRISAEFSGPGTSPVAEMVRSST